MSLLLSFFGSIPVFISPFPQNLIYITNHLGPSPTLCPFVTGSPRAHTSLPTGHAHVRPQPPEALSGSPKTLLAPEVSGELLLGQVS